MQAMIFWMSATPSVVVASVICLASRASHPCGRIIDPF
jgi:hypothetical protein